MAWKPLPHTGHASSKTGTWDPHSGQGNDSGVDANLTPQTQAVACPETKRPHDGHWNSVTDSRGDVGSFLGGVDSRVD